VRPMRMVGLGSIAAVALAASLSVSVSALPAQARPVPPGPGPGGYPTKALIPSPGNKATADPPRMTAAGHQKMSMASAGPDLTQQLATARLATAKYATNLSRAKADGYQIITKMMPNMGFHFMNPKVQGFSIRKPQILVYEHHGSQWQLGALEWVFGKMPKNPPLPNATFGSFPAACHYRDGTFIPDQNQKTCPKRAPHTGARFTFWHPDLVTMHVWAWYPNSAGLYSSTNPLVAPFNHG
jgi:hypothetical protein